MARWWVLLLASAAVAQVQLEFAPPYRYSGVAQLPDGRRLLVGSYPAVSTVGLSGLPEQILHLAIEALGPVPGSLGSINPQQRLGGSGNDVAEAIAVDSSGNIWIAGETDSDDFTLVNPIVSQKAPYRTAGFVMEIDPTGQKLLFSTYLGGQHSATSVVAILTATHATAIAVDSAGNAYVGGDTNESDFPTTPGAIASGKGGADQFGNAYVYSYLAKISPAGKLIYSTELATGTSNCVGGSSCIGHESTSATVSAMAVDSGGSVTLAGLYGGGYNVGSGYVTKVAADASKLTWSVPIPFMGAIAGVSMAQDSAGNVNLFGEYATVVGVAPFLSRGEPGLFTAKLSGAGATVYANDLGLSADARAAGMLQDGTGNVYVAGASSSAQFPSLAGVPNAGADFVLLLDATGAKAQRLWRFPGGVVSGPPAFASDGRIMIPGANGALLSLPPQYAFDSPAIVAFANSASFAANAGLFPGALVTLFGFDLPTGVQVQVGGVSAPIQYASANQINFQVPFELPQFAPEQVQVAVPGGTISFQPVLSQSLGIFTSDGVHAAALNQDGSVNSASNPAAFGSIVSLFGTGANWPAGMKDGAVATAPLLLAQFEAGGLPVLYEGSAPGLIDGVFQINLEIPPGSNGALTIQTTNSFGAVINSNPVQVYLK